MPFHCGQLGATLPKQKGGRLLIRCGLGAGQRNANRHQSPVKVVQRSFKGIRFKCPLPGQNGVFHQLLYSGHRLGLSEMVGQLRGAVAQLVSVQGL